MDVGPGSSERDRWVRDCFGVDPANYAGPAIPPSASPAQPGVTETGKPVGVAPANPDSALSRAARNPQAWSQTVGPALTREGPGRPGARIKAPPAGPATECVGPTGKKVSIVTGPDGRVAMTHAPPPIREITFSGGGGKGAALPGAVRALSQSGVLAQTKEVHGASVGSLTAAMVAAGVTPEAFQKLSDDTKFGPLIKGNELIMLHVKGDGLEDLVRSSMGSSINAQIAKFAENAMASGTAVPPETVATLKAMTEKFGKGAGPTFKDLRVLSKIIPDIKEVVISGTMTGTSGKPAPGQPPGPIKDSKPQLMVFDADTQPDMEVARAVHASAALPPVFKPVDIPLASGEVGRFEDGGVLNNAPSSDTLGDRAVDPVPDAGKMTFVFEDEAAHGVLKGEATPERGRIADWISGAEHSAAEYDKNRQLADRPEDVVMVPLKFKRPSGKEADFTGMLGGTMNFDMAKDDKLKLQGMTESATLAHLKKRQEPETRSFDSPGQMLACATRDDLEAMAASDYPGAREALAFRDKVAEHVRALEALAGQGGDMHGEKARALLGEIEGLAGGDQNRIAFIGRELNRSGKLDALLASAKAAGGKKGPELDSLAAGLAVQEVVAAKATARRILQEAVYPKMVREGPKGVAGTLLKQMDTALRDARSTRDINRALNLGIDYFGKKLRFPGEFSDRNFADMLKKNLQPVD